jgi:REP element-mobilizing transposase RayT
VKEEIKTSETSEVLSCPPIFMAGNLGGLGKGKFGKAMNKERNFYKDTFHHLYNRGANKGIIFFERENYLYFLRRMKYYSSKFQMRILAYCLMQTHFHLFVQQLTTEYSISMFISSLLNSYVKSLNKKYKRGGTLFESKTKSKHVCNEEYFKWVIKYILENPLKAGLVERIDEWEFSNAKELLNTREEDSTDVNFVRSYFQSVNGMEEFLFDKSVKTIYEF